MLSLNGIEFVRRIDGKQPMSDMILLNKGQNECICLLNGAKSFKDSIELQNSSIETVIRYRNNNLSEITIPHLAQLVLVFGFGCIEASKDKIVLEALKSNIGISLIRHLLNADILNFNNN